MLPYTQNSLTKLEELLKALGYRIRYERGNFRNGTCVLQTEHILVVNRFSDMEVKIKSMIQVIQSIDIPKTFVPDQKQEKLLRSLHQTTLDL